MMLSARHVQSYNTWAKLPMPTQNEVVSEEALKVEYEITYHNAFASSTSSGFTHILGPQSCTDSAVTDELLPRNRTFTEKIINCPQTVSFSNYF